MLFPQVSSRRNSLFAGVAVGLSISLTVACGQVDPLEGEDQGVGVDSLRTGEGGGADECVGMTDGLLSGQCLSNAEWQTRVAKSCAVTGAEVQDFRPDNSCGEGSSNSVSYACCGGHEPACFGADFAAANGVCLDQRNDVYRSEAEKECAATGGALTKFVTGDDCGSPGYSNSLSWTCCGVNPPSPTTR